MMKRYYYADVQGCSIGPLLMEDLERLLEMGYIRRTTCILEEGSTEWMPYARLEEKKESHHRSETNF